MPGPRFEAFTDSHLDDAANLLEERHRRQLASGALVAEEPDFPAELEQALAEDGASGCALVEDGEFHRFHVRASAPD